MRASGTIYRMNLGLKWNFYCRGAKELGVVTRVIIGNLSMPYLGFCGQEHLGVVYRRAMEIGKILTGVFSAGATKEFGSGYWKN